jgi:hypothetical protein
MEYTVDDFEIDLIDRMDRTVYTNNNNDDDDIVIKKTICRINRRAFTIMMVGRTGMRIEIIHSVGFYTDKGIFIGYNII